MLSTDAMFFTSWRHRTIDQERSQAQRIRMNSRLASAYDSKHKISCSQQMKIFLVSLKRRKKCNRTANKRLLETVEAATANKKRHNEKFVRRDRFITSFFAAKLFGGQLDQRKIMQSSTAPIYNSLKYAHVKVKTKNSVQKTPTQY